jgi:hypothetical protein
VSAALADGAEPEIRPRRGVPRIGMAAASCCATMGTVTQKRIPIAALDGALESSTVPQRFSWGAVIAGAVAGLASWVLLYSLGRALGLTALDAGRLIDPGPSGFFTGWWMVITPLPALFVGGLVAGRSIGAASRGLGAVHGLVLWGVTTIAGVVLLANLADAMTGSVIGVDTVAPVVVDALVPIPEADDASAAYFGAFGALVLGMIASMAGAAIGVSRRQAAWADLVIARPMTVAEADPATDEVLDARRR